MGADASLPQLDPSLNAVSILKGRRTPSISVNGLLDAVPTTERRLNLFQSTDVDGRFLNHLALRPLPSFRHTRFPLFL